jgi:adenylate kinase family enzyme
MKPQAFIFIGRSGCGKGTQVKLLMDVLAKNDPKTEIMYIATGNELREFIKGDSFTQKKCKELYDVGGLQPEFLAVGMWVNRYFRDYNGTQHVIMDGMPRKLHEAGVLHSCLEFYGFQKPWVINIDISNEESRKRLLARKRVDDNDGEITRRLAWYETDVEPTIEYYDGNPKYNFLKIPGERTIEEIHADIVKRLGLV